jgi:cytochrome oxidase Cu insertion factor (SCO1/SenC/PrrC family)
MRGNMLLGLLIVCLWLAGDVVSAQEANPAYFQAMHLTPLSKVVPLPNVSLPDLTGKHVTLRSFRGKVVLLNFWTTW